MYIGSVRFFKHLIYLALIIITLLILLGIKVLVDMVFINTNLSYAQENDAIAAEDDKDDSQSPEDVVLIAQDNTNMPDAEGSIVLIDIEKAPEPEESVEEEAEANENDALQKIQDLGQFGNRVLFVSVDSPGLIDLHNKIYDNLGLEEEKRGYTPHLTIVKQRPKRPVEIDIIRKRAETKLIPAIEYTLDSITVYYQPKEHSIYVPYMEIPLGQ
jgi:2'-5' RNA ligase